MDIKNKGFSNKWLSTVNAQFLFFDLIRVHFNWQQEGDFIDHTIDLLSTLTVGKHPILVIMSFFVVCRHST